MKTDKRLWRNRNTRKKLARRLQSENPGLEVVHPRAAGIDVGNSAHYVAVRPDCDPEPVRRFECFTADLLRLANWLQSCGVKTVGSAVDRRILDSPVRRHFGRTRFRGLSGQRAAHQEPARTQERCAGKPVAAKTAHLRIVEQFIPTSFEDSYLAHLLAATRATREWSSDLHSTNAESADADEHTISECDQRSERSDWTDDRTGHRRWGTRSAEACGTQSSPDSGQPETNCRKPGGQLARS